MRLAFIENFVPTYRFDYFRRLAEFEEFEVTIYANGEGAAASLPEVEAIPGVVIHRVATVGQDRRWVIQKLPWRKILRSYDCVFIYANPRYFSSVLLAELCRLTGVPYVLRNHYKTAGASPFAQGVRLNWTRLHRNLLVYTEQEAQQMRRDGFRRQRIVAWGNGLDSEAIASARSSWTDTRLRSWQQEAEIDNRPLLFSTGRLIEKNRYELGLEALHFLKKKLGSRVPVWCLAGGGPLESELRDRARELQIEDCFRLLGPVYQEADLAPWFLTAKAFLHPGAVGLSAIHALNYGVPVITHGNRLHQMPEFDALTGSINAALFEEGNSESLAESIEACVFGSAEFDTICSESRQRLMETVRATNSTAVMAQRTRELLQGMGIL